jgi:hypothetical protein
MGKQKDADRLLEAARKVTEAEARLSAAKAEYHALFKQITRPRVAQGGPWEPVTIEAPDSTTISTANLGPVTNGEPHITVADRVHAYMQQHQHSDHDAATLAKALNIPTPTIRWALVELFQRSLIVRPARGQYRIFQLGNGDAHQ